MPPDQLFPDREFAASLRAFFDAIPEAVVILAEDGSLLALNSRGEELFGVNRDDLRSHSPAALLHRPESQPALAPKAHDGDYIGARSDGTTFPFSAAFSPVEIAGLHLTAVVVNDLTERRQFERALRESEERYHELLERASDVVYTHDMQGNFTWVNQTGITLYGYTRDEIIGLNIAHIVDPEDLPRAAARMAEKAAGGETIPYTVLTRSKDGTGIWVEVATRVLRDDDGNPVWVQGIARDVSSRVRAEAELQRTYEFRDRVMENTRNAIAAMDMEGRLTLINRRASEMTGFSEEELIGQPVTKLFDAEHRAFIATEFANALSDGGSIVDYETELTCKDGSKITVLFNAGALVEDGRTVGFAGTAEDITDRRRAEALVAAQRHLMEMVALDAPLAEVYTEIILAIETHAPGALCAILELSEDGTELYCASAPSLPPGVVAAAARVPLGENTGSCGAAALRGEPVTVADVSSSPIFEQSGPILVENGLRACWSTPIFSAVGEVLGTFAVFHGEVHEPSERERELVSIATYIAGVAIERRLAREAVIERATELETLYAQLKDANEALSESKARLEEKSGLLQIALDAERERGRRDPLTNALNHAAITDAIREHITDPEKRSLAIAMVDVDGLKAANDTYGHQIGDAVLIMVARALDRAGAIIGRYGGDEFVALLPDRDRSGAERYRQQVMAALDAEELFDPDTAAKIHVVVSMGMAIYPEEAQAVDDLIKLSDSAMYAQRRQRAAIAGAGVSRMLASDRAAKMIGEIVPFLTTPGDLEEKLRLVAMRLSIGAGYDAVSFMLYGEGAQDAVVSNSFANIPPTLLSEWEADIAETDGEHPMRQLLDRTKRPVIIDDITTSDLMSEPQRRLLMAADIRAGLMAPMIWQGNVVGALAIGSKRHGAFGPRDAQFAGAVATQVSAIVRTAALVDELQEASSRLMSAHMETVVMLAGAAEAHDHTTGRHLQRVQGLTEALALELGHDEEAAGEIGLAAVLHDIGKIRVPDYVLTSAESLGDNEWALMKQHTVWGSQFLGSRRGFELASQVARSHHERWDGTGYPDGLAGESIPEAAQITSVADSLDAMTSDRPYRAGRPIDDAVLEVQAWSGRQFSPRVVEVLVRIHARGELGRYLNGERHTHQEELAA